MVRKLRDRHINVVVHIINGLPYENEEMMLDTVRHINALGVQGIKIHMLHIIKDTGMANLYLNEKFHILSKDEYIDIVVKQLEILEPKIIVNRITSDPDKETLLEPTWLLDKCQLLNDIDKEMKKRNTYQGINL
jgi:radical SAM protein (TIGR01212 family)